GRLTHHRQMLRQLSWIKKMRYVAGRTTTLVGDATAVVRESVDSPNDSSSQEVVRKTYAVSLRRYRPKRYSGGIKLSVSQETPRRTTAERWGRIVGGPAQIHTVPGDHETYIRDHVKWLRGSFGSVLTATRPTPARKTDRLSRPRRSSPSDADPSGPPR